VESSVPSWITAIAAVAGVFGALAAWVAARRSFKREMATDLFGEYGKREMGEALTLIHKEFRASTGLEQYDAYDEQIHRQLWVDHYVKLYNHGDLELHWARRKVSQFFQKIAYTAEQDRYATSIALRMWGATENFMVLHILLPIETIAMPIILHGQPQMHVSDYNPATVLMWKFWRTSTAEQQERRKLGILLAVLVCIVFFVPLLILVLKILLLP
jgi:hypothetical protein